MNLIPISILNTRIRARQGALTREEVNALKNCVDWEDAIQILTGKGFEFLSNGCFAHAFARGHTVVKVGLRPKVDGWLDYARWIVAKRAHLMSPAFPKISLILITGECYIAEMEKLGPNDDLCASNLVQHAMSNPTVGRAMNIIHEKFPREQYGYDLHKGNWLMRGKQIVITDPLSSTEPTNRNGIPYA